MTTKIPVTSPTPLPVPIPAAGEVGPLVGKHFGNYELGGFIGEGPTGSVYLAQSPSRTKVIVKIMHHELSTRDHAERLWSDLERLAQLRNPHFVQVIDCGFGEQGQFYYAMEELIGVDLEAALEESGALAPRRAIEIIDQLCEALEVAHAAGVVHGGLKPRNIFLSPVGGQLTVKVLDFGATRFSGGTDKGVIVGNPFYMAPEQFGGHADPRTDIYSLGVLMYELFSGTLPFVGPSHGQVMMRHLAEQPKEPPGVPLELGRIILRALSKTAAGRYPSIAKLRETLRQWAQSARTLEDAAAVQVIARAAEARKMKQSAALSTPDSTAPTPKLEMVELARASREQTVERSRAKMVSMMANKQVNPNSSESVEASLEDFINQANATFPATDGWDLNTGDVELVDDEQPDEELEEEEHVAAPAVVKPIPRRVEAAAQVVRDVDQSVHKQKPVDVTPEPPAPKRNPFATVSHEESEPAPLDPPPTGPRRKIERTEVVAHPLGASAAANPLIIIGAVLVAFVIGAGLVIVMMRTMIPAQPVVVQAPAPVPQPTGGVGGVAAAPTPPSQPVVTPLQDSAKPVVTALQPKKAPEPEAAPEPAIAPTPAPKAAAAPVRKPIVRRAAPVAQKAPAKRAVVAAAADDDDDEAPAAKKPAKAKKAGGDWVDPFAQ
jgi:serine/threonine protein kinase